jgi:hypothetical protein
MTISNGTSTDRQGERRWLVVGEDGRHAWLGRHSDPSPQEIAAVEASLSAQGLAGWLATAGGDYWRRRSRLVLLEVRPLGTPVVAFADAVLAFEAMRAAALEPARCAA